MIFFYSRRLGHRTTMELKCSVTLIGDYKLSGKLLVLPIEGEGKYKIQIRKFISQYHIAINIYIHTHIQNFTLYSGIVRGDGAPNTVVLSIHILLSTVLNLFIHALREALMLFTWLSTSILNTVFSKVNHGLPYLIHIW